MNTLVIQYKYSQYLLALQLFYPPYRVTLTSQNTRIHSLLFALALLFTSVLMEYINLLKNEIFYFFLNYVLKLFLPKKY